MSEAERRSWERRARRFSPEEAQQGAGMAPSATRTRRTDRFGWFGWFCWFGLCASLTVSARGHHGGDDGVLEPTRGRGAGTGTRTEPAAEVLVCNKAAWRVPGQYLVALRQGTHASQVQRSIQRLQAGASRGGQQLDVLQSFSGALSGFLVRMSSDLLHLAARLPHVDYIEEDSSIFAQSAPWNLQRLMQPHGAACESGTYRPPNDGRMADVYLMDGSVQTSHREVQGRVTVTDFSSVPEEDGVRAHRQASRCEGHGTHVAGVIGGADSGVARGARLNVVRVLNCQGKGTVSGAVAGLEYIRAALLARPPTGVVVLLPFIGGFSRSLNAASRDLVAQGAVVLAAAGNYREDACLYSPASEPEVITVGAVNLEDQLMSQGAGGTNFGRCVDLFAPGDDIVSASSDCNTCFTSQSGTSQAAAHAAGIAAVILSSHPKASPVQVLHTMLRYSTSNAINFLSLSDTHQLTTPNLMAAMPPDNDEGEELLCRSVWSERSGVRSTDRAITGCRVGEEMMSCSSYAPDGVHAGESIAVHGGRMQCVAYNGPRGAGVYAVARCCVIGGLQCQVHASPEPGQDAECDGPQHHLTGWTAFCGAPIVPGSRPRHGNRRRCVAKDGMTSHAVCCHAPSLECHLLEEISAGWDQVEVSCPSGWTMTDCGAVSQGSALIGSGAEGNSCRVRSAAGAAGTVIGVCCRVRPPERGASPVH